MAFAKLALKPGVLSVASQLSAEGTWWNSVCVRFFLGFLQKLGGWTQLTTTLFIGTCRGLFGWYDLLGNDYLAVGTEQRLEVFEGGSLFDITPLRSTDNVAVSFTTHSGNVAVTIDDATNGAAALDWVNVVVPVSVGGIVLQGFYLVQSVTDADHYVVNAATPATASIANGGAVPTFTPTNTSPNVEVTLNDHGLAAGALFAVQVATTVGGITIAVGSYPVLAAPAPTTNTFYIAPAGAATSGATVAENSGDARIEYLIHSGVAVNTSLTGYGIGDYGAGDYGLGSSGSTTELMRQWSLDNWGQLLLASPTNGAIYSWDPPYDGTPAAVVSTAPAKSWWIFVIGQLQVLVSLGAESGGTQYPNLVRWSDTGDYTDFIPSVSNEAGSFQIPTGSNIVAGVAVGLGALIWTNIDVWSMVYEGLPFVFGFNRVGVNCEAMSPRAPAVVANAVMWPSIRGFFRYDSGGVNFFPCPVWDFLFTNIDYTQLGQLFSAINTPFNEIGWHFPLSPSSPYYSTATPMAYVKFNAQDGVWDQGVSAQLQRSAWTDHGGVGDYPVGADLTGLLQQHETSPDANGQPLSWSATSGYFDIQQGEDFAFIDLFIPDVVATPSTAQVQVTIYATDYPGDTPKVFGPYTWTPETEFLTLGVRGRQAAIMISGNDLGSTVRLGAIRYRVAVDGKN